MTTESVGVHNSPYAGFRGLLFDVGFDLDNFQCHQFFEAVRSAYEPRQD